jgi:DNA-binding NtrC family response regulator
MSEILIVDDDKTLRALIADFLNGEGYECTQADNVAQACSYLKEKKFNLTISDFDMPTESGIDLLKHVASNFPTTSFIMMSGNTDPEVKKEALSLGALAFMAKPFRFHELLNRVEDVTHCEMTLQ